MSLLPRKLEIELTDDDLERDLVNVIDSMNYLRHEALNNRSVSEEACEEYVHLAYRLASIIDNIDRGDKFFPRLQSLAGMISNDRRLLDYDTMQRGYWKEKNPDFVNTLDQVLVSVMKDNVLNMDSAYHVFNAVKYLGADDDERDSVLDSITPFNAPVVEEEQLGDAIDALWKPMPRYKSEEQDALTLRVDGSEEHLADAIDDARKRGYKFLQANTCRGFDKLKNARPLEKQVEIESYNMSDLFGKLIHITRPLSWIALGNMPGYFTNLIEEKYGKELFDKRNSIAFAVSTNFALGFASLYGALKIGSASPALYAAMITASACLASDFLFRFILNKKKEEPGSLLGYLLFGVPAALCYAASNTSDDLKKKNPFELTLHPDNEKYRRASFDAFKKILSEKPRSRFNTIINNFAESYPASAKEIARLDEKNLKAYYQAEKLGDYNKTTVLARSNGSFYLLSMVNVPSKGKENEEILDSMARTISNGRSMENKLMKLEDDFDLLYARLARISKGKEAEFAEAVD